MPNKRNNISCMKNLFQWLGELDLEAMSMLRGHISSIEKLLHDI